MMDGSSGRWNPCLGHGSVDSNQPDPRPPAIGEPQPNHHQEGGKPEGSAAWNSWMTLGGFLTSAEKNCRLLILEPDVEG